MATFDYQIYLSDKEYAILRDLYYYRVFTTDQIRKKHFNGKGTYVNNVLYRMRKKGLIKTATLRNSRKGKKGYSYHRMTETGLERLYKHGMSVEGKSSLYVKPRQVPHLLMANDLVVDLAKTDWEIWDSRSVKSHFNLDDRMNIQGLLISPEKTEYGLYVLDSNTLPTTIGKIQSEIRAIDGLGIQNYLIATKGQDSFHMFINHAIEPTEDSKYYKKPLLTGNKMKVYPYGTFIRKAKRFRTERDWLNALCDYYNITIKSVGKRGNRQSFPIIVDYKGEEMYLVDCTDLDLNKVNDIELYSKTNSSYRWEGRKVLAIMLAFENKATIKLIDHANNGLIDLIIMEVKDFENTLSQSENKTHHVSG